MKEFIKCICVPHIPPVNHDINAKHGLTHWGWVTHICVGILSSIGSDDGLSPGRRQAIIWTNAGILLIEPLGTNFSEIVSRIQAFSFKKMHLKMSSAKWRPFYLGLNVLIRLWLTAAPMLWFFYFREPFYWHGIIQIPNCTPLIKCLWSLFIIDPGSGLSPARHTAVTLTNAMHCHLE